MKAIKSFKQDFHTDMGGVFAALKKVQSDVKECSGRIAEAEQCISATYDEFNTLQGVVGKFLSSKADDLESRSRGNNAQILGIPEKEEGSDPSLYMDKWNADSLNTVAPVLERAHRTKWQRHDSAPRTFIVRRPNYKDTESILRASRAEVRSHVQKQQNGVSPTPVGRGLSTAKTI